MDPAIGRGVIYSTANSRPAVLHLGTTEVRGQYVIS